MRGIYNLQFRLFIIISTNAVLRGYANESPFIFHAHFDHPDCIRKFIGKNEYVSATEAKAILFSILSFLFLGF